MRRMISLTYWNKVWFECKHTDPTLTRHFPENPASSETQGDKIAFALTLTGKVMVCPISAQSTKTALMKETSLQ